MNFNEALKDTNKALKKLSQQDYIEGFKYPFKFFKQGLIYIFYGLRQLSITLSCLLVYPLLPIIYPIAVVIRMVRK